MLTILFSDIANFTTISENLDSDDLAKLMNTYFQSAVGSCIHSTEGTVVNNFVLGTNLAAVDVNSNIVHYNGYYTYASGTLQGQVTAQPDWNSSS